MKLISFASILISTVTGLALVSADNVPSAGADRTALREGPVPGARSLAGEQWHYRAQVDGRGHRDSITITAQPGFTLENGFGVGEVLVHVDFSGHRGFAEARQQVSYYSVRKPWTPWLGATDLDRRGGNEIVLGFTTGAHSQGFTAYAYRPDGELLTFRAPRRDETWFVNSSYGTGTSGWKCTRRGVQARAVSASGGPTVRIKRISYVMGRNGDWRRTKRVARTVKVDASGNPPAYTAEYARFACAGLPKRVL